MKDKNNTKNKKNTRKIEVNEADRAKKSRKGFYMKILIFILLAGFFYFAAVSTSNNNRGSVFERLDSLKQSKKPYLVVVRDSFSPLGRENKKEIESIIKKAEDNIVVFDIIYDPENLSKEAQYFIDKYDVESLPVIILCDEKGEMISSYYLPLNEKQILGSVEKARESSVK